MCWSLCCVVWCVYRMCFFFSFILVCLVQCLQFCLFSFVSIYRYDPRTICKSVLSIFIFFSLPLFLSLFLRNTFRIHRPNFFCPHYVCVVVIDFYPFTVQQFDYFVLLCITMTTMDVCVTSFDIVKCKYAE